MGLLPRLNNLAPEERPRVSLVEDRITQLSINLEFLEICPKIDVRDLGRVKDRVAVVRDGVPENLKVTIHCRLAAQAVRGLRHRHNSHLVFLIVVFGIEDATYVGAIHSCLINKSRIMRFFRKVLAILWCHAEPEPLSVRVAPTLRQNVG